MIVSCLIITGFLGSIFAMFRFAKYVRLLNSRKSLPQEEADRYQARAKSWLAAMGCFLGVAGLAVVVGVILQIAQ